MREFFEIVDTEKWYPGNLVAAEIDSVDGWNVPNHVRGELVPGRFDYEAAACAVAHAAFGVDTPDETPFPEQCREDARIIVDAARKDGNEVS